MRSGVIARKEIRSMIRERSFALIILLELLLVSSSGLLSVGYVILTSPESSTMLSKASSLVYVGVVTDTRLQFESVLDEGRIHHTFYNDFALAEKDFKEGLIDAVFVGDIGTSEDPSVLKLYMPSNSPKTPLIKLSLKRVLVRLEDKLRDHKVGLYAPGLEFASYELMNYRPQARYVEIYFIFTIPLLLFLPCIVSGSLAIDSLTQDFESKRMLNLVSAPLSSAHIVFGKAFGAFFISIVQCLLWLAVLSFTFVSPKNHLPLTLFCSAYTIIFLNIGSLLALYLKRMKSSQIIYTFASMTAISLFSPFANIHPLLLEFSPSYLITRMALGTPPMAFAWQLSLVALLAVVTTLAVLASSHKVNEL
ncbi:MAG: ABC transporter permease subunit [Candidatus Altiarchaeales archaeon]|nr:ABC transporter permease subunit [Candidatus Altiarchaeales archaeon]MBD3417163.1 ABC transporter permease subunit [Candidatus Altiarchaeales archaeon]